MGGRDWAGLGLDLQVNPSSSQAVQPGPQVLSSPGLKTGQLDSSRAWAGGGRDWAGQWPARYPKV